MKEPERKHEGVGRGWYGRWLCRRGDLTEEGLDIHRRHIAGGPFGPSPAFASEALLALVDDDLVEVLLCEIKGIEGHEGSEVGWGFVRGGHSGNSVVFFAM